MLHAAVNLLTMLAMLGHAALGCCRHHAHGPSAGCQHVAAVAESAGDHDHSAGCDQHRHTAVAHHEACDHSDDAGLHDESSPDDPAPCDHGPCEEQDCTYVVTEPAEILDVTPPSALHAVTPVETLSLAARATGRVELTIDRHSRSAPDLCALLGTFLL